MNKEIRNAIVTLENGNMYYVFDEYTDTTGTYDLLINVNNEDDVEIVIKKTAEEDIYLEVLTDIDKKYSLAEIFKTIKEM